MELRDMLQTLVKQDGSDLSPPLRQIQRGATPLNETPLNPGDVAAIAEEIMDKEQKEQFERELEMNLAVSLPQVGHFRINIFKQRN